MSPQLYQFYVAYAAWLDADTPACGPFTRDNGLCDNLGSYIDKLDEWTEDWDDVPAEMIKSFMNEGLDRLYPFNCGSSVEYADECNHHTVHLNPQRIAWVRKQIEKGAVS